MVIIRKETARHTTTELTMQITLAHIQLNADEPDFENQFREAANQFCNSPFNDEGAALAAIRKSGLQCKPSTEKVLVDKMARFALKSKSARGLIHQDVIDLFDQALKEYLKREKSLWSFLYF